MRLHGTLMLCLIAGLLFGCQEDRVTAERPQNLDAELVRTLNTVGVESAIVSQRTLYPYHFVQDSDELNTLGRRDLMVLARHFKDRAGAMNVRRDDTSVELYEARVARVLAILKEAGVDADRLALSDGMPGGDGMASERVIVILSETAADSGAEMPMLQSGGTAVR
ncbi:MAG: hypothetical protein A2Y77_12450 [Planctomycetes bacterium RBG_13_62_9]|nr:MAG: hypothetical protein A2Y77_12450 [Planctomycetes bacterium RBG_13_62_9]